MLEKIENHKLVATFCSLLGSGQKNKLQNLMATFPQLKDWLIQIVPDFPTLSDIELIRIYRQALQSNCKEIVNQICLNKSLTLTSYYEGKLFGIKFSYTIQTYDFNMALANHYPELVHLIWKTSPAIQNYCFNTPGIKLSPLLKPDNYNIYKAIVDVIRLNNNQLESTDSYDLGNGTYTTSLIAVIDEFCLAIDNHSQYFVQFLWFTYEQIRDFASGKPILIEGLEPIHVDVQTFLLLLYEALDNYPFMLETLMDCLTIKDYRNHLSGQDVRLSPLPEKKAWALFLKAIQRGNKTLVDLLSLNNNLIQYLSQAKSLSPDLPILSYNELNTLYAAFKKSGIVPLNLLKLMDYRRTLSETISDWQKAVTTMSADCRAYLRGLQILPFTDQINFFEETSKVVTNVTFYLWNNCSNIKNYYLGQNGSDSIPPEKLFTWMTSIPIEKHKEIFKHIIANNTSFIKYLRSQNEIDKPYEILLLVLEIPRLSFKKLWEGNIPLQNYCIFQKDLDKPKVFSAYAELFEKMLNSHYLAGIETFWNEAPQSLRDHYFSKNENMDDPAIFKESRKRFISVLKTQSKTIVPACWENLPKSLKDEFLGKDRDFKNTSVLENSITRFNLILLCKNNAVIKECWNNIDVNLKHYYLNMGDYDNDEIFTKNKALFYKASARQGDFIMMEMLQNNKRINAYYFGSDFNHVIEERKQMLCKLIASFINSKVINHFWDKSHHLRQFYAGKPIIVGDRIIFASLEELTLFYKLLLKKIPNKVFNAFVDNNPQFIAWLTGQGEYCHSNVISEELLLIHFKAAIDSNAAKRNMRCISMFWNSKLINAISKLPIEQKIIYLEMATRFIDQVSYESWENFLLACYQHSPDEESLAAISQVVGKFTWPVQRTKLEEAVNSFERYQSSPSPIILFPMSDEPTIDDNTPTNQGKKRKAVNPMVSLPPKKQRTMVPQSSLFNTPILPAVQEESHLYHVPSLYGFPGILPHHAPSLQGIPEAVPDALPQHTTHRTKNTPRSIIDYASFFYFDHNIQPENLPNEDTIVEEVNPFKHS